MRRTYLHGWKSCDARGLEKEILTESPKFVLAYKTFFFFLFLSAKVLGDFLVSKKSDGEVLIWGGRS